MPSGSVAEVVSVFLKLGTIAFGGPAAHVGLLRDEVVRRRRWVTDERFMDLLGMTNLIPGPNSTEMAIHLGYLRAGWPGLIAGGVCFIVPAMLIVLACAWLYVRWGTLPQAAWLLYGVKPVIIAVVVQAMWSLLRTAVKGPLLAAVGAGVVALYLAGGNEILLLLGGGGVVMLARAGRRLAGAAMVVAGAAAPGAALGQTAGAAGSATLGTLFLLFLKIGAVLYGSGYVLLAFLRGDFVERLRWLTDQQLLDAIAIGQFTPGPVLTTATFIGYLVGGVPGGLLATVGIFLPGFVENRQIAAIDKVQPQRASRFDQAPKMGIQLRRTTGQVEGGNALSLDKAQQQFHGLPRHLFLPLRTGSHVAVQAGLIAAIAEIGLQGFQADAPQGRKIRFDQQWESVVHAASVSVLSLSLGQPGNPYRTLQLATHSNLFLLSRKSRRWRDGAVNTPSGTVGAASVLAYN